MPESESTTMCMAFFQGKLWVVFVFTIEVMAVGGEKGGKCQADITLK